VKLKVRSRSMTCEGAAGSRRDAAVSVGVMG